MIAIVQPVRSGIQFRQIALFCNLPGFGEVELAVVEQRQPREPEAGWSADPAAGVAAPSACEYATSPIARTRAAAAGLSNGWILSMRALNVASRGSPSTAVSWLARASSRPKLLRNGIAWPNTRSLRIVHGTIDNADASAPSAAKPATRRHDNCRSANNPQQATIATPTGGLTKNAAEANAAAATRSRVGVVSRRSSASSRSRLASARHKASAPSHTLKSAAS